MSYIVILVWKHMIRLTDTSHIANFLSYYYTPFLPVAHNIHFAISTGYYLAIFFSWYETCRPSWNEYWCQ